MRIKISELVGDPKNAARLRSCDFLRRFHSRNMELLKESKISLLSQIRELNEMYGVKISRNTLYSLRNGLLFTSGSVLLASIVMYWENRGKNLNVRF